MKKPSLILLLSMLVLISLNAQQTDPSSLFSPGPELTPIDSLYLVNLPELTLPPEMRQDPLPPVVDNSLTPYLRPVFGQEGASCGQACLVGYNFTYEIDRYRDADADSLENQYATHFTYNFMNGGNGWFGVSYFHSMEVLRLCGNMNCVDYGGSYFDDGSRWINGYDVYYNAMHNRISGAYSINTGTMDGLMTLKHWLYDHLEGSPYGGVASFYANTPWNAKHLNINTPEGGKYVVTGWYPDATHAMTIVGYNDSIRWDYNNDGVYTNDIDLNGDQVLDARDWEIGGVKFVNSHGTSAQDSGFCYLMYKVLAETFENGGVWNRSVHVLDIKENYEPLLTYKVILKHDYREKVRVRAGVNPDTTSGMPAYIMDFPIFNFQGANYYMQGQGSQEYLKTIEFGLDVTPLYSWVEPGQPARYFLLVDENDPNNEGTGDLIGFTLIDYSGLSQDIGSDDVPTPLQENGLTVASLVHQSTTIDKPQITTQSLPAFTEGAYYAQQLQADGGSAPYTWDMAGNYIVSTDTVLYNPAYNIQIMPNDDHDTIVPVPLVFGFPYFGKVYDTVWVHTNGYLQFKPDQLPYPYLQDQQMLLRGNRIIAPLTNDEFFVNEEEDDGVWYVNDNFHYSFHWKVSWTGNPFATDFDFIVTIMANGGIRFEYGNVTPAAFSWASGISNGDMKNCFTNPLTTLEQFISGKSVLFHPSPLPQGMEITSDGLFSGTPGDDSHIYDILFRVTDHNSISSTKRLQFTSWPILSFVIHGGEDNVIDYGDTVTMDAILVNPGIAPLTNCTLSLDLNDPYVEIIKDFSALGTVPPGDTAGLGTCFEFVMAHETPDSHPVWMATRLDTDQGTWLLDIPERAVAPLMEVHNIRVLDGNNGILESGETAGIEITLVNLGHSDMTGMTGHLTYVDPVLELLSGSDLDFGDLLRGYTAVDTFQIHALDSTPNGYDALLRLETLCDQQIANLDSVYIQIGKMPVLVIDLDPHFTSGPAIYETMQEIGVISHYRTYIPGNLDEYQCLFICLGYYNSYHELTWQEGYTLAQYLNDGGRIYMEGRITWSGNIPTPLHDKFNINGTGTPAFYYDIEGIDGTFMEGVTLINGAAQPVCMYWLYPTPPAFNIMQDSTSLHCCAIAHDAGTYRTIGTIFELGSLEDGLPPSTKAEMILRFMNFFGIDYSLTDIHENEPASAMITVNAAPNPFSDRITIRFSLEKTTGPVSLTIYDLNGRLVRTLANNRKMQPGNHELQWDGRTDQGMELGAGIYFCRIVSGEFSGVTKIIFLP